MIRSSACQPWQPDRPGHAGDRGGPPQLHHATGHDPFHGCWRDVRIALDHFRGRSPRWPYSLAHDLRRSKPLKAFTPYTDRVADRSSISASEIQEMLARIDHETPRLWINDLRSDLWSKFLWNKRHVRCTVFDAVVEGSAVEIVRFRRRLPPSVPGQLSKC